MLRKWFGPRALLWHFLMVGIVYGCLYAGWWQVHRAMAGNVLSYLYSVEWPAFAVTAVIGWWQLIQEDPAEVEARKEERRRRGRANPVAYDQAALRRELAAHPELVSVFPELARAFPELAAVSKVELPAGATDGVVVVDSPAVGEATPAVSGGCAGGAVVPVATTSGQGGAAEGLRDYNDRLAALAATGRAKSWRNPRGR